MPSALQQAKDLANAGLFPRRPAWQRLAVMTALTVSSGIVALVWGALLLQRLGLLAGAVAVLIAGCCFGALFYRVSVGPLPITADRVLLVVLLAVYAGCRWRGLAANKPIAGPDLLFGAWLTTLVLSTVTHDWQINDSQPLATLLFFFLMPAGLYWLGRQSELNEKTIRLLVAGLAVFGVYLACTALAETQQAWWLVYPRYIASAQHEEFFGRGRGPLLNPIGGGLYLTAALLAVGSCWPTCRRPGRAALVIVAGVLLVGTFCTLTRSVWLGAATAAAITVVFMTPRAFRVPLLAVGSVACVLAVGVAWGSLQAFKRDQHVSVHDMSQSASLRPILASVAWRMFLDRPLFGCGFGQYKQHDMNYWRDPTSDLPLEQARHYVQHNVLLALLTETGCVGTAFYVALLIQWTVGALVLCRDSRAPPTSRQFGLIFFGFLVAFLINGMFHDVSIIPMVNMLLFLLAGVAQGLLAESQHPRPAAAAFSAAAGISPRQPITTA